MLPLEAEHDVVLLQAAATASIKLLYSGTHALVAWAGKTALLLSKPS